jgi:hypothetical protein
MKTSDTHDKLNEIPGRVRVLSLAATGLAEITADDDLGELADLADEIERQLTELADSDGNNVVRSAPRKSGFALTRQRILLAGFFHAFMSHSCRAEQP